MNTVECSKQSELELARAAMFAKGFGGNVAGASAGGERTVRWKKEGANKSLGGESQCSAIHHHTLRKASKTIDCSPGLA